MPVFQLRFRKRFEVLISHVLLMDVLTFPWMFNRTRSGPCSWADIMVSAAGADTTTSCAPPAVNSCFLTCKPSFFLKSEVIMWFVTLKDD